MRNETARRKIESLDYYLQNHTDDYGEESHTAMMMAIKALQKQIPQKPTIENGFVKCPACKLYIRFPIMDRYNNCPECGQALKWEGE